jgi:hypothetical protein
MIDSWPRKLHQYLVSRGSAAQGQVENVPEFASVLYLLNTTIAALTPLVAALPVGSSARFQSEQQLRQATRRRENLTTVAPTTVPNGPAAMLLALDVRQIEVQIPEIELCIAEVTAHRATLSA